MERKTRRVRSLFSGSNLDTLSNPIEKSIKPSQIYYDIPDSLIKPEKSYSMLKDKVYGNYDLKCSCRCHKYSDKYLGKSLVTTAESRRGINSSSNSPIKISTKELLAKRINYLDKQSIYPYDTPGYLSEGKNRNYNSIQKLIRNDFKGDKRYINN